MDTVTKGIVADLGFVAEMDRLRAYLFGWIGESSPEMQPLLEWQFDAGSKYFRPLTIFGWYRIGAAAVTAVLLLTGVI